MLSFVLLAVCLVVPATAEWKTRDNVCKTTTGMMCKFPFMFRGITFNGCTSARVTYGVLSYTEDPWCATAVTSTGSFPTKRWNYCADPNCNVETLASNETNETEIMLFMPPTVPTPPPTMPTSEVKVVVKLTKSAVESAPDAAKLKAAMKASLESEGKTVSLDQIETVVEYAVEQSFTFPSGVQVTESVAKKAVATTFSVAEDMVVVVISQVRRLQGQTGRRLAGTKVDATIKTTDPGKADTMKTTASSTNAVAATFATNFATHHNQETGDQMSAPQITATAPTMEMEVSYKIVSTSTSAVVEPPASTALKTAFTAQGGTLAEVSSTMTVATPAPTSAPTPAPTLPAGATHVPTSMPTRIPTSMPTTPAPTDSTNTTTAAAAPKGSESAAFSTKVSGYVAMALTMAMLY